jgi:hypothetical protein
MYANLDILDRSLLCVLLKTDQPQCTTRHFHLLHTISILIPNFQNSVSAFIMSAVLSAIARCFQ